MATNILLRTIACGGREEFRADGGPGWEAQILPAIKRIGECRVMFATHVRS